MHSFSVLHEFDNIGFRSDARSFPGFLKQRAPMPFRLAPREGRQLALNEGDLVSIEIADEMTSAKSSPLTLKAPARSRRLG
ncbi:hypothetical protein [Albirhodobacter sp. R86504]|uniref:hypothetical protein n=1 Tax=Albirhodobacter sp. R86504 TaxID=3093848 RepID=UPI00366F7307